MKVEMGSKTKFSFSPEHAVLPAEGHRCDQQVAEQEHHVCSTQAWQQVVERVVHRPSQVKYLDLHQSNKEAINLLSWQNQQTN